MVAEQGMTVDEESFRQLMQEQKQRAREARKALGDLGWAGVEFGKDIPATEFVGYDHDEFDATVVALVADDELRGRDPRRRPTLSWCWTGPRSTRRWAARRPTTAPSAQTAFCSPCPTCRRTRAASSCTMAA